VPQDGVALTVAAVARRLGVAPATLRTWDRRYGLGPSGHSAGAHRRYSASDVARLLTMRRLTLEGVAPSEAARMALVGEASHGPSEVEALDAYSDAAMAPDPDALVTAARHVDNAAVRWMLARVHPRDTLRWWSSLVRPAMNQLAAGPAVERPGQSATRLLEAAAFAELRSRAAAQAARAHATSADSAERAPVALAVPVGGPDLVVHVLAVALDADGVGTVVLTGGETDQIAAVVADLAPHVVLVHVGAGAEELRTGDVVDAVARSAGGATVFVHREHGTIPVEPGLDVHRVRTLAGAYHEVLAALA
jgi:DNA-binding transcriptional MerR regulator